MKNPYEILGVDQNASMKDIIPAMAKAMTTRKHKPAEVADAKVQLSTPAKRLAADFTFPITEKVGTLSPIPIPDVDDDIELASFDPNKYDSLK